MNWLTCLSCDLMHNHMEYIIYSLYIPRVIPFDLQSALTYKYTIYMYVSTLFVIRFDEGLPAEAVWTNVAPW